MEVTLNDFEQRLARSIAKLRNDAAEAKNRPARYGLKKDKDNDLLIDIHGCAGEIAVAKYFNRYWTTPFADKLDKTAPDVGHTIQVRTNPYYPNGHLLMHPSDRDDQWFILVLGTMPTVKIAGGIWGQDAKQDKWWKEKVKGRACYFVPQSALIPAEKLLGVID